MKQSQIDKLVKNAKIELIDDESSTTHRVTIEKLNASFDFESKNDDDVREKLRDAIVETLNRRGVEITG